MILEIVAISALLASHTVITYMIGRIHGKQEIMLTALQSALSAREEDKDSSEEKETIEKGIR